MAAKSTVHKVSMNIVDTDRNYYEEHHLRVAKHPSENDFRMMIRLIAFAFNADESLLFGEAIATEDEADLWIKDLSGDVNLWIILGQADEKRIRKACGKSEQVIIYTYQEGPSQAWYKQIEKKLTRFKNLSVIHLNIQRDLEPLVSRNMDLQCSILDNELLLVHEEDTVQVTQEQYKIAH